MRLGMSNRYRNQSGIAFQNDAAWEMECPASFLYRNESGELRQI